MKTVFKTETLKNYHMLLLLLHNRSITINYSDIDSMLHKYEGKHKLPIIFVNN